MLLPAEIETRTSVPAIRALIARKLVKEHRMNQQGVAQLLGVTQAAVSNYLRGRRGSIFNESDLMKIEDVVNEICSMMVENDSPPNIIAKFNDACRIIRQNRMLCDVHKQLDPSIDVAGCHVCDGTEESEWKPISLKQ